MILALAMFASLHAAAQESEPNLLQRMIGQVRPVPPMVLEGPEGQEVRPEQQVVLLVNHPSVVESDPDRDLERVRDLLARRFPSRRLVVINDSRHGEAERELASALLPGEYITHFYLRFARAELYVEMQEDPAERSARLYLLNDGFVAPLSRIQAGDDEYVKRMHEWRPWRTKLFHAIRGRFVKDAVVLVDATRNGGSVREPELWARTLRLAVGLRNGSVLIAQRRFTTTQELVFGVSSLALAVFVAAEASQYWNNALIGAAFGYGLQRLLVSLWTKVPEVGYWASFKNGSLFSMQPIRAVTSGLKDRALGIGPTLERRSEQSARLHRNRPVHARERAKRGR